MKKILAADPAYKQMTAAYEKKDGLLAVGVYLSVLLLYLGAGYLYYLWGSILPSILANALLVGMVLVVVRARKQKLHTVGFTLRHWKQSLLMGGTVGLVLSVGGNVLPAALSGGQWVGLGPMLWNFFYMLVNIAFTEELVFRGYIQTRLYGLFKSDVLAVIVGGLLFMGMHIPFQLFNRSGGHIIEFFTTNALWLLSTWVIHLLFNFMYRKYNSLAAPTVCHFLLNFGSTLFQ